MQTEKQIKQGTGTKGSDNSPVKQIIELEDDYAIHSRIANSRSMLNMEGYPVIERTIFDLDHTDPDESEYCSGDPRELEEFDRNPAMYKVADVNEGYAVHRRSKVRDGYDY